MNLRIGLCLAIVLWIAVQVLGCAWFQDKEEKTVVVKNARFDYLFQVDSAFLDEFPEEMNDWKKTEVVLPKKKEEKK